MTTYDQSITLIEIPSLIRDQVEAIDFISRNANECSGAKENLYNITTHLEKLANYIESQEKLKSQDKLKG